MKTALNGFDKKGEGPLFYRFVVLHKAAPLIIQAIRDQLSPESVFSGHSNFIEIDFSQLHLEEALKEVRVLRQQILQDSPIGDQEYILEFFDAYILNLNQQFNRHKQWTSLENKEEASQPMRAKDSRFHDPLSNPRDLSGTLLTENHYVASDREQLLKKRADFLAHASKVFSSSIDYQETISKIAALATDEFCDWCIIDALDENEQFRRAAVGHRDPVKKVFTDELRRDFGPHANAMGVPSQVLRERKTLFIPEVNDSHYAATRRSIRHEEVLRALGSISYMCVPMTARGSFIGAITLVHGSRRFTPEDVVFAEEFCSRAALAIDNAIQFQRAQSAVQMRDDFVGIVSHDLKSPLQVIDMSSNLMLGMRAAKSPERITTLAETIRSASKRMNRLIADLLDLSSFDAGKFKMRTNPEDAVSLLREVEQQFSALAQSKEITLIVQAPEGEMIQCDRDRLLQAIGNLVSNAIKFTPNHGSVSVKMELTEKTHLISVQDTGSGILPDALPRIFDRYWQAPSKKRHGTGLGLSIVKMMTEAHGGSVKVTSEPERGSTFILELPKTQTEKTENK